MHIQDLRSDSVRFEVCLSVAVHIGTTFRGGRSVMARVPHDHVTAMEDGPGFESMSTMRLTRLVWMRKEEYTGATRLTSRRGALPFAKLGRCEGAMHVSDLRSRQRDSGNFATQWV